MNRPKRRLRIIPHSAIVSAVAVALLCVAPVEAGWLGRGVGVAGAGYALKETLEENTGILGEILGAVIEGDGARVSELAGEIAKTPGKIVRRAFPVLEAPHAVAARLKSAKRKIGRFVGGVGERVADARGALQVGASAAVDKVGKSVTDARAALAVDRGGEGGDWNDAALLEGDPLSVPVGSQLAAPNSRYDSPAEGPAAPGGDEVPRTPAGADGEPAAASWDIEDRWASAQPVRAEVPAASSGNAGSEYAAALAGVLDEDPAAPAGGGYLAALNTLEAKEVERLRLEEEAREQARLAEEEAREQARLAEEEARERAERPHRGVIQSESAYDCQADDQRVIQAMHEARDRAGGTRGTSVAYCAAVNVARAYIWGALQRLNCDDTLIPEHRRQIKARMEISRRNKKNFMERYSALTSGGTCSCWSSICAD